MYPLWQSRQGWKSSLTPENLEDWRVDPRQGYPCYYSITAQRRGSFAQHRRVGVRASQSGGGYSVFDFERMKAPMSGKGVTAGGAHCIVRRDAVVANDLGAANLGKDENGAKGSGKREVLRRLWNETRPEAGRLGVAALCLAANSTANLMTPTVMARVIDRAASRKGPVGIRTGGGGGGGGGADGGSNPLGAVVARACAALGKLGRGGVISDRVFLSLVVALFAAGSLASWARVYNLGMATCGTAGRLRAALFRALMRQEKEFFDERKAGELAAVLAEDVDRSSRVFTDKTAAALRSLNSACNASLAMLAISPGLTLVSVSTVPLMGSMAMLYSRRVRGLTKAMRELEAKTQAFAEERLSGLKLVRAFAREEAEADKYEKLVERSSILRTKEASAKGFFMGGLFIAGGCSLSAVLWCGGSNVGRGNMTAGQLTSFAIYSAMVGLGFSGLFSSVPDISRGLDAAERVFVMVDREPAVNLEKGDVLVEVGGAGRGMVEGDIAFEGVWFKYKGRDKEVLRGVDFSLGKGQVLAIVGASGVGKSTVSALLTRLYEPDTGRITLDGVDISTLNPSWLRRQVGVVDQEPLLFAGSILDNIRYGSPRATEEDVVRAAQQANAHGFISSFPDGYATLVGEHGRLLSGGEKQRVAIARAVLEDPPILVLDEATSALDAESERAVTEAIERLLDKRTVLVIAHRQSTVRKANVVAVLEDGRVVESGTYPQLMAKTGGRLPLLMEGDKGWPVGTVSSARLVVGDVEVGVMKGGERRKAAEKEEEEDL